MPKGDEHLSQLSEAPLSPRASIPAPDCHGHCQQAPWSWIPLWGSQWRESRLGGHRYATAATSAFGSGVLNLEDWWSQGLEWVPTAGTIARLLPGTSAHRGPCQLLG